MAALIFSRVTFAGLLLNFAAIPLMFGLVPPGSVRQVVENLVAAASPSERTSSAGPEAHQRASRVLAMGAAQSIGFI